MKTGLTRADALPLTAKLAADLAAATEAITTLDAAVGDGDLGVTCRLGMQAALALLPPLQEAPLHEQLLKAGMAFNAAAASTFGALVATAAMRAAKQLRDQPAEPLDLPALTGALRAAAEGIQQRGKAARGIRRSWTASGRPSRLWRPPSRRGRISRRPSRRRPPQPKPGPRRRVPSAPSSGAPPGCRSGPSASETPGQVSWPW